MTHGFRRWGVGIAGGLLAVIAILSAVPLLVPPDRVREAVSAEVRRATGLDLALDGDVAVSLFPTGSVRFRDVRLGEPSGAALTAAQMTARLGLFSLIGGNFDVSEITLERPTIIVNLPSDGRSNWADPLDRLAAALAPAPGGAAARSFSEIQINDGIVVLQDPARGLSETLRKVNVALAWPAISRSFAATGRFVWRDEPVDASLMLSDFAAALAGDRSGVKLRLHGTPLKVAFDGALSARPTLKIDGTLAADSSTFRDALRWIGDRPLAGPGLNRFALKARTSVAGGTVALTGVTVQVDDNIAEGVLSLTTGARPTLQGTLAANDLDFTSYLAGARPLTTNEREWSGAPLSLDALNDIDLDLRLSARSMMLARAKFGRAAMTANLRNGRLTMTLGEAQLFGGIARGSLVLAAAEPVADFKSQFQLTDVDFESALSSVFDFRRIEGRGSVSLAVDAQGSSVLALMRSMNGTAELTARQGALVGVNVETLLKRLERRPLSGTGDFRSGRTPFDRLAVSLKISHGTAAVQDVRLEGSKVRLGMTGTASIPARDFDLRGVAALVATSNADAPPLFELPFVVHGPWDDPIMLPDTQALIMRSPAASPLLDAVKSRTTRDSVRSALERLTGVSAPEPARPALPER